MARKGRTASSERRDALMPHDLHANVVPPTCSQVIAVYLRCTRVVLRPVSLAYNMVITRLCAKADTKYVNSSREYQQTMVASPSSRPVSKI